MVRRTDPPAMTIAVYLGRKAIKQKTNKNHGMCTQQTLRSACPSRLILIFHDMAHILDSKWPNVDRISVILNNKEFKGHTKNVLSVHKLWHVMQLM